MLYHLGKTSLEVRDVSTILAVAEAGSFRKASQCLGLGQPAVSRRVLKLEETLGVSLFERRSTGAQLTNAGWSFANRARSVLNDLHAAIDAAQAAGVGGEGKLNIGMIASLSSGVLRQVVADYISQHPGVDIVFAESERSELLTQLSHRLLDVVIATGEFSEAYGDSTVLIEEPMYLALCQDHPLNDQGRLSWTDLKEADFLVSTFEPGPEMHEFLFRQLASLGMRARINRHRLGREGIMNLVGLGLGVSLVADHWRGVEYPNVTFVPIGDDDETIPLSITWRPENDNPALRRFISLARIEAKKNGALS